MSCRSEFDFSSINFEDFHTYPSKIRKKILNDPELIKLMVRGMLKEERYLHSLAVAETARELALHHHVDPDKAYMAGLLHDVTKYLSDEEQDEYLRYYDPVRLDEPPKVKHAYTAKYFLKEKCGFPEYYGANLDALHDVLAEYGTSFGLIFENCGKCGETMQQTLDKVKTLLTDLERDGNAPFYRFLP